MQAWHKAEPGGLQLRLSAMRMFPFFFNTASNFTDIDGKELVGCMRNITRTVDRNILAKVTRHSDRIWNEGGATKLLLALVDSHIQSLSGKHSNPGSINAKKVPNKQLLSGWTSLAATVWIYLHGILEVSSIGRDLQSSPLHNMLLIIQRDMGRNTPAIGVATEDESRESRSFELWKIFTAALAVAKCQRDVSRVKTFSIDARRQERLQNLQKWFEGRVRSWSEVAKVSKWAEAKAALQDIAWPALLPGDEENFSSALWNDIISAVGR
jgi:hypothetical protein